MKSRRVRGISIEKKIGSTLIAMTIIIFMIFLTLGMFSKSFMGKASATIATAQTTIVADQNALSGLDENNSIEEQDVGTYTFYVKNTDKAGNKVTEVTMKYTLTVETEQVDVNNPVTVNYELYKVTENNGNEIETKINDWDATNGFINGHEEILGINGSEVHKYKLKFVSDNEGEFKFKVKVRSEQVD